MKIVIHVNRVLHTTVADIARNLKRIVAIIVTAHGYLINAAGAEKSSGGIMAQDFERQQLDLFSSRPEKVTYFQGVAVETDSLKVAAKVFQNLDPESVRGTVDGVRWSTIQQYEYHKSFNPYE